MAIDVFCADEQGEQPVDVERYGELVRRVLEAVSLKGDVEVCLLFVDEVSMADLNERFLGESGPTDVLAFPIEDEPEPGGRSPDQGGTGPGGPTDLDEIPLLLGDVVVCPAVARATPPSTASSHDERGRAAGGPRIAPPFGMDHEEEDEAQLMEQRQRDMLERFGSSGG